MSPQRPRKRFGQHFLTDPGVIDAIVGAVAPAPTDVVAEIGPGRGAITVPLARRAGTLHAIELDRDLAAHLERRFAQDPNVTVHQADALGFDYSQLGPRIRVVGNLPYNISTPLLFALLGHRQRIVDMHVMLQKEVVDRMAATPGSKAYGRLGIMLGCRFRIEKLFEVDRLAFDPPPEVTSGVVRLTPLPAGTYVIDDEALFGKLVATAFSQRRKTVRNALRGVVSDAQLEAAGIDPGIRPEGISIAHYVGLANAIE
jgi:16S rRNA (adenine1518-N6/adenine1519-N6)-dimethyltransferase